MSHNNSPETDQAALDAAYGAVLRTACCVCGLVIENNPSNMCLQCLRARVDITQDLLKQYILVYCPECERYLQPPKYWARAATESRELMSICLKKINGLSKYTLVDAVFVWTEEHSKRLRLKITLQKELYANTMVEQTALIEFEVKWQQCPACAKAATGQPQWDAVVQLRQKVVHRRTFLYLEQLILKHRMHENVTRIESQPEGIDFYYGHRNHAQAFVNFIGGLAPVQRVDAAQLVSHDSKSNTAVQHYTFSLQIAPLCREDLVLLPKLYYERLGGLGPFVLVHKVYSSIVFMDPYTMRAKDITGALYWKHQFPPFASSRDLVEFYVVDIEPTGTRNGRFLQAIATVCLSDEIGQDRQWLVNTHLGAILHPGDYAKGYLLSSLNIGAGAGMEDWFAAKEAAGQVPEVVLVRKHCPAQVKARNRRQWRLRQLDMVEADAETRKDKREMNERDRQEFLDEVERDPELRRDVQVFYDPVAAARITREQEKRRAQGQPDEDEDEINDPDRPVIELTEMLNELTINEEDNGKKRQREDDQDNKLPETPVA